MSISKKLTTVAENVPKVYEQGKSHGYLDGHNAGFNSGYKTGYNEGEAIGWDDGYNIGYVNGCVDGQRSEYDRFWDVFQDGGKQQNYYYAFAVGRFDDSTYNPKYPIRCSSGTTPGRNMFYNSKITDTKVPIYANNNSLYQCFNMASSLKTIRLLSVYETTTFDVAFTQCTNLENITFEGTIGKSLDMQYSSNLTLESAKNVLTHLKDFSGGAEYSCTIYLSGATWALLDAVGATSPNGNTWREYVDDKKWSC